MKLEAYKQGAPANRSLHDPEDVRGLRLRFFERLLAGYDPGTRALEVRSGAERIQDIVPSANVVSMTPEHLLGGDLLAQDVRFDQVVWFNGLNWIRPRHAEAITALSRYMDVGGNLYLSCASKYLFEDEDSLTIEKTLAREIRRTASLNVDIGDFNDRRFGHDDLKWLLGEFEIVRFEHVETDVELQVAAFREWHQGSAKCLLPEAWDTLSQLHERFFEKLWEMYQNNSYRPRLGTALIQAVKIGN